MLDLNTIRAQHLAAASAEMGSVYGHAWSPPEPTAFSFFQYGLKWLAQYAHANPAWTRDLENVAKKPIVDWIVARHHLSGMEKVMATLFVGFLLDVLVTTFIKWELQRSTAQTMLGGSVLDTLARFDREAAKEMGG